MHAVPGRHRKGSRADEPSTLGRGVARRPRAGHGRRVDLRAGPGRDEPGQAGAEAFPRGPEMIFSVVIPAKAGIHWSAIAMAERWIPAFAGMTVFLRVAK